MSTFTRERLSDSISVVAPRPEASGPFSVSTPETLPSEPQIWILVKEPIEDSLEVEQWLETAFQGAVRLVRVEMSQLIEGLENRGEGGGFVIVVPKELWGDYAPGLVKAFRSRLPQAGCWFL